MVLSAFWKLLTGFSLCTSSESFEFIQARSIWGVFSNGGGVENPPIKSSDNGLVKQFQLSFLYHEPLVIRLVIYITVRMKTDFGRNSAEFWGPCISGWTISHRLSKKIRGCIVLIQTVDFLLFCNNFILQCIFVLYIFQCIFEDVRSALIKTIHEHFLFDGHLFVPKTSDGRVVKQYVTL